MANPPYWKIYCRWRRQREELNFATLPETVSASDLDLFAERYKLARAFKGVKLDGYSNDAAAAHCALLRAFLAYSALEQFHKAVESERGNIHLTKRWAAIASTPATELNGSDDIIQFLIKIVSSEKLKKNLTAFQKGDHDNVLIVATALRHAVAHGYMSFYPDKIPPKTVAAFCNHIAKMLLTIADQSFIELLESLSINFGPAE